MRLRWQDDFKEAYPKVKGMVADPKSLHKNLTTVVHLLLSKQDPSTKFVTNRVVPDGAGWYECYIYKDKKVEIILQYKIEGEYVILSQIGSEKDLMQKRKIRR